MFIYVTKGYIIKIWKEINYFKTKRVLKIKVKLEHKLFELVSEALQNDHTYMNISIIYYICSNSF